jgi:hypothetical protein
LIDIQIFAPKSVDSWISDACNDSNKGDLCAGQIRLSEGEQILSLECD